ncbi:hypothetical protein [Actinoplanes regularis]|uniref:Uncharacterized protein n=1 Tax=Actinoplanes regularis TaxID=52697 RepID=A0A238VBS8_9ACTN|nr:hypothetical protein [Actinoplanes regularis]GIE83680.1 hypothetical protein Are01nite_01600 [Actinoplanes regularis]SNR31123.1 hypothetical protein SAMN06264365_101912 [Actinoplanes regularis]
MPELIDDVVRRLYEEPPDGFVATRAAAVGAARAAGDREAAKRLAACKKPTVAAWVVNLLARKRPDLIEELVELSGALRAAQRDLHGDQLRELSQQRRAFVSALVAAARKLAVAAGAGAGKLPLGEVEATLAAALADPEIAGQVRTGRLIRATAYAGFGEVPRPRLRLITGADEAEPATPAEAPDEPPADRQDLTRERAALERRRWEAERRRRELERELTSAEAAERHADQRLERAQTAERDARNLVDDLEAELAELERRRTEAVADVARRKQARRTAERESAAARRRVGDVQAALDGLG